MPPRLQLRLVAAAAAAATAAAPSAASASIPAFLVPFVHRQVHTASILANLSDIPAAYNKKIRRGRGPSSGKGKTSGRGHKGQKQHGKVPAQFQGGQTPDEIVRGKEGFKNLFALQMSPVNLDRIQDWINQGRIDPSKPITLRELAATRAVHGIHDGIKLLARGATGLTTPINIVVSRASQSAIAAVEALGGTVTTRFYTKYAIDRIRQRKTDPYVSLKWEQDALGKPGLAVGMGSDPRERVKGMGFQYRLPDPTSRKDLEYYRDPKNRGYLSHTVKEGEGPSLYFKPPLAAHEIQARKGQKKKKKQKDSDKQAATENRLW